jgi:Spy/CpxP family protein refolding chaperone
MRKLAIIVAMFMAVSTFALPVYAMGGGMGGGMSGGMGGSGMMGNFGSGLFDWFQKWRNGSQDTNPSGQQMEQLERQHDEDSAYLKYQIRMKEKELDALLNSPNPDLEKVRALHKGIQELRAEAAQEQRNYERQAGGMNPGYRPGTGNGWSSYGPPGRRGSAGMGYGQDR